MIARKTSLEQGVARALTPGATLKVLNSDQMAALDCQGVARAKPGQVIFA